MDMIKLQNIAKSYGGKVVFRDVNLSIPAGAFVVVRGESGAGKSTLLNIIGGLESASSGQVIVDSQDVAGLSSKERVRFYRSEVGIIFQGSYLQPQLSILDNITLPGVFAGMSVAECTERVRRLAESLGIVDVLEQFPQTVSGGQAERACIARALFLEPKIILADEPTSNLDPDNARAVLEILDLLRRDLGLTIVMVSHNDDALNFATQVVTVVERSVRSQFVGAEEFGAVNQSVRDDFSGND